MMVFAFCLELLLAIVIDEELLYWGLAIWLFALWCRRMVNQYRDDCVARNWGRYYFDNKYGKGVRY